MASVANWEPSHRKARADEKKKSGSDLVESNLLDKYLSSLKQFPLLPHPETVELFKQYNASIVRDEEGEVISRTPEALKIRNKLTESNLRLVVSVAKLHRGHKLPLEDIIEEGNIGLMKAVDRFKHEKGFRFSTYATWWIRQSIGQYILKQKNTIRMPAHAKTIQRKMMQAAEEYRESMGCEPTTEELMALVGASATVVKATMHAGRGVVSLQQPLSSSGESDTIEDRIEDDRPGSDPFENVAEKELLEITQNVLSSLSAKEAAILRLRFGLVEDSANNTDYPITEDEAKAVMEGKGLT